ncbi:MAG: excinuclease ABC subunit UvrA [Flavobacteriales bacterium]|nr:excinuclease ABC subunit UvrA [Flavobacteriales bacterium]MCB9195455.1 excinuclease ABC subunit UvrA [Flavobacteriales bacterium]MCB9198359.1 excinuclease ABC subunit UvrA [Flavobacteriales bacterium]
MSKKDVSYKTHIVVKGAKVHNLKNVDVAFLRNKMTVVTGMSGSGKSSLAFDTLYAEGQRRYVESLSSYARQFLGRLEKPDVESIKGISPAIAIEQKVNSSNPRSTVGTSTEIYDFLKLMYARIGKTISPISGKEVKKENTQTALEYLFQFEDGIKGLIIAPIRVPKGRSKQKQLELFTDQGFRRIFNDGNIEEIEKIDADQIDGNRIHLIIDRIKTSQENNNISRIAESIETAFIESDGQCEIVILDGKEPTKRTFSNLFELDGIRFEEPTLDFFAFNNPVGACPTCEGFGKVMGIDKDLVIPNKNLSIYDDAVACWRGESMSMWKNELVMNASDFDFPIHRPYLELTEEEKELLWTGNKYFSGLNSFFKYLESKTYKIQYRVMLSRYRGRTDCPDCLGSKLRKDAHYVKIGGRSIAEVSSMSIDECKHFFSELVFTENEQIVANRIISEVKSRLNYLSDVGLGYLTLNRLSNSLSGGESQRINLATSIGSSLVGSMYILDEPSIGLHPRDTHRLLNVLRSLRDIGNTVIIVEHEEEVMRAADEIIDMGPMAGTHGGEVVFQGVHDDLIKEENSLTAKYLTGRVKIETPSKRRSWKNSFYVEGARENNLKNINVKFPLEVLTVITGVSGSGKSTLIKQILYPALKKNYGGTSIKTGECDNLSGDFARIEDVEFVDQNPIGKSSRSNPVTYVKAFDDIRNLYSDLQLSVINGFKPKHFSFNVEGGRCDACEGEGEIKVSMQFMADVLLTCEQCNGKRFKDEVLEVKFEDKSIYDILTMTIEDAIEFFGKSDNKHCKKIIEKIIPLQEVGLGYVQLGQSSNTLSGGEAQRIKLASFLSKKNSPNKTLFIFDEPTTGLHFHDIKKLLKALNALIEIGHSVIVIEHNAEVIKCADWVIDLGPEGGKDGGNLVFEGTPEDLVKCKASYTGKFLKDKL